jgi:hypothetical protein
VDRIRFPFGLIEEIRLSDQEDRRFSKKSGAAFCSHILPLEHNLLTVLAGPGAHRVSGRMAVTSRRGFGIHVSEGVRRAGIPERSANASWKEGGSSARHCPWKEHGAGRVTGRPWRQTPDGRAWECLFLSYEFVRRFPARPSSRLFPQWPDAKAGVATEKCVSLPSPTRGEGRYISPRRQPPPRFHPLPRAPNIS